MKKNNIHRTTGQRQQEILNAALGVFSETGVSEASVSEICRRAGASVGSLYHHFKSKENLAAELYLQGISCYQAGLTGELQETDAQKGISAVISYHCLWAKQNRDLARFLARWRHEPFIRKRNEDIQALNREFALGISDWFKARIEEKVIKPMQWDMIISILLGPAQEYIRHFLNNHAPTGFDEAIDCLSKAAWQALRRI